LITAEEALQYGLVNEVVASDRLYAYVEQFALSICSQSSTQAMGSTKQMIATIQSMELSDALQYAAEANATARGTTDCKKGIAAFLNKEQIVW
jgi:methylglutaconyl-CoA hydratase